jgi:hypothetical protein
MYQKRYITARGKWASIAFSCSAIQAQPLSGSLTLCGLVHFFKLYPRTAAILVNEIDAGGFESAPHNFQR